MPLHAIAIQAQLQPEHYRSDEAFRARVLGLVGQAVAGLDATTPRVIAFPEAFALPLLFWHGTPQPIIGEQTALKAALQILKLRWREALQLGVLSPSVFYHLRAMDIWPLYEATFKEAARVARAYVVAGSLFSPIIDWEPARGYHRASKAVYNQCLLVSPEGTILSRVPKVNLTKDERSNFLSSGPLGNQVVQTRLGKLAVLICLDAFHEGLIEYADASGAWLVVQPSANAAAWNGPWSANAGQIEGEVWLREGLAKKLQGRENLRYGLNPMLNGRFYGLEFEGQSGIYEAGKALALAKHPVGDEVIRAHLEWPQ
jgi:predicted amidohydrolase